MNEEPRKKTFDEAAHEFDPKPASIKLLRPYKDGIAALRRKGASYRLISELLRNDNIQVSRMTVARFCHSVLKQRPAQKRNADDSAAEVKPVQPPGSSRPAGDPALPIAEQLRARRDVIGPWTRRKRGPRIADAKNL